MSNRKRFLLVLLVCAMLFCLCACTNPYPWDNEDVYRDYRQGKTDIETLGAYLYESYVLPFEETTYFPYVFVCFALSEPYSVEKDLEDGTVNPTALKYMLSVALKRAGIASDETELDQEEVNDYLMTYYGIEPSFYSGINLGTRTGDGSKSVFTLNSRFEPDVTYIGTEEHDGVFSVTVGIDAQTDASYRHTYRFRKNDKSGFTFLSCETHDITASEWTDGDSETQGLGVFRDLAIAYLSDVQFSLTSLEKDPDTAIRDYFRMDSGAVGLEAYRRDYDYVGVPRERLASIAREVFSLDAEPDIAAIFGDGYDPVTDTVTYAGFFGGEMDCDIHHIKRDGDVYVYELTLAPYGEPISYRLVLGKGETGLTVIRSFTRGG